jgi:hypothetical protein
MDSSPDGLRFGRVVNKNETSLDATYLSVKAIGIASETPIRYIFSESSTGEGKIGTATRKLRTGKIRTGRISEPPERKRAPGIPDAFFFH